MKNKLIAAILMFGLVCLSSVVFGQDEGKIKASSFLATAAQVYYDTGDNEMAIWGCEEAIKTRPEDGTAHYYLALAYERSGQKEKAISSLDSYLNHVSNTSVWLEKADKEYIAKCKELLSRLRAVTEKK